MKVEPVFLNIDELFLNNDHLMLFSGTAWASMRNISQGAENRKELSGFRIAPWFLFQMGFFPVKISGFSDFLFWP